MGSPHFEEGQVIDDLCEGLALAIDRDPDYSKEVLEYLGETKLQKLCYFAIQEFNLPVTYSWYLAGAKVASNKISSDTVRSKWESSSNEISSDKSWEDSAVDVREKVDNHERIYRLSQFFRSRIEEIQYVSLSDFLQTFYKKYAPSKYRELYLKSLRFRQLIQNIANDLRSIIEVADSQATLANFVGTSQSLHDRTPEVSSLTKSLRLELENDPELHQTVDTFSDFSNYFIDFYSWLVDLDSSYLSEVHLEVVHTFQDFFFNQTWQHPCLYISKNTVTGPRSQQIVQNRQNRLDGYERQYQSKFEDLRQRVETRTDY